MISNLTISPACFPLGGRFVGNRISRRTCIYAIENRMSGMSYIGSTINVIKRFHHHRGELRAGVHSNHRLQSEFNYYKEHAFIFVIVEYCEKSVLLGREQEWLDRFFDSGSLLNIYRDVEGDVTDEGREKKSEGLRRHWAKPGMREAMAIKISGKTNGSKPYSLIDPSGNHVSGVNLAILCRTHGLDTGAMCKMMKGYRCQCCGWTLQTPHPDCKEKSKRPTKKEREEIIRLSRSGLSITKIRKIVGRSHPSIKKILLTAIPVC